MSRWHRDDPEVKKALRQLEAELNSPAMASALNDTCPRCGGPITFSPADADGVTVFFHCANAECDHGKDS